MAGDFTTALGEALGCDIDVKENHSTDIKDEKGSSFVVEPPTNRVMPRLMVGLQPSISTIKLISVDRRTIWVGVRRLLQICMPNHFALFLVFDNVQETVILCGAGIGATPFARYDLVMLSTGNSFELQYS